MMEIGNVHHMGYLVKNLEKSVKAFCALGYETERDIYFDSDRMAEFCLMKKEGNRVELVSPDKESDLYPLLRNYSNTIYHVCYEVRDIDETVKQLEKKGWLLFKEKERARAISEKAVVVFMMNTHVGIIELLAQNGEKNDSICREE